MELYNEDCLEGMKRIPDGAVDMILTDLPYGITDCKWDKATIDLPTMWAQFNRILKPCCSAVMFASGKFTHKLIASNFDRYKYKWFWVKNDPTFFVHAKNAPMRKVEEILIFSDGAINHASCTTRRMKYNPQGVVQCKPITLKNANKSDCFIGTKPSRALGTTWIRNKTGYPSDVIYFDIEPWGQRYHPTQKPVDLLEYLIKTYTNEGELVLDATMGSGSTGVAAVNTGRDFIGFEPEKNFYDIACKRIADAQALREQNLFKDVAACSS